MNSDRQWNTFWVDASRNVINLDSSPSSSTVEVVNYLAKLSRELGFHVEVLQEIQNGVTQSNIIVRPQAFVPGQLEFLLETHLDTSDPGNYSLWTKNGFNPFDAAIEDGKIYGLGAAEVKLDFLCKLKSLVHLKDQNFKTLKPVLVGTFGEEAGMQGALKLIRKNKINAKYALVGETSQLRIINASKGFAVVDIRIPLDEVEKNYKIKRDLLESTTTQTKLFSGKAAHSSTPHLGDNAIKKMLDYLQKLPENMILVEADGGTRYNTIPHQAIVEFDINSEVNASTLKKLNQIYRVIQELEDDMKLSIDSEFVPEHSTLSFGVIRTFEDHLLIGGSCRILPSVSQELYERWMTKINKVCSEVGAQFRITDYKRPFRTNHQSILVKTAQSVLEKLGRPTECMTLASTNEASLFTRKNVECICIGAGLREGNVHTPQEHVSIEELEASVEFYQLMIERFCL